ncbi:YceD family protein [Tepidimicrobium xylanilyticum]|uniref:ACR, COG1399 n=1 Tax=Tepidimicrobium xylanilyticum TaxID=1123352 RepID=A0A1H2YPD1_9FIRM|nr:DUF177 domain-containing protein [Tepidimicrobium xylanilyticum]SDX06865.1 uncharacterized protein SAMN05660923_01676 [Tepidimicrobium xylanilyticum]
MSIDLSNFRDETVISLSVEGQLNKDSLEFNGRRIRFTEPIKYDGEIYKVGKEKYLHVNINYRYEEVCGRCLEAFSREDKTVLSGKLVEKENEIGLDEDEDLIYYYDERLELAEYVVDAIIVSLPMKPLCHEGCKGLCAKCGANRNKDDCQCVVEDIDPRFAILRDLFPRE